MPPDAAPVEAPNISTPGVAPTEKPQLPSRSVRAADFQKQFEAKAAELGGLDDAQETEAETPAAPVLDKPNGKKPAEAKPEPAKPAEKESEAVSVSERAEFRNHQRREREKLAAERAAWEKEKATPPEDRQLVEWAKRLKDAKERGDPEAFAKELDEADFNSMQENWIKRLADPNYQELKRIQRELDERKKREEQQETEARERQTNQERAQMRQKVIDGMSERSSKSTDKLAVAMAKDPGFLGVIYQIQAENWDPEQGPLPIEKLLDMGRRGSSSTVRQDLKQLWEALNPVFSEPPALAAANGRKPAPRTAVTPPRTTDAAGGKGKIDPRSPEWNKYAALRLAEAKDE